MADKLTAPLFTADGTEKGSVELNETIFGIEPNTAVMHQVVKESRLLGSTEGEINGLRVLVADSEASMDGQPVELGLAIIWAPTGKVVIVIGLELHHVFVCV